MIGEELINGIYKHMIDGVLKMIDIKQLTMIAEDIIKLNTTIGEVMDTMIGEEPHITIAEGHHMTI